MFEKLYVKLNSIYEKIFESYGYFLSKYYKQILIASFIINLILSSGILRLKILTDTDELFNVKNSQAKKEETYIKNLFNLAKMEDNFYIHQLPDLGMYAEINFHVAKDPKENILQKIYINEISNIHKQIMNKVYFTNDTTNKTYFYNDLCTRRFNQCLIDGAELLNDPFFLYLKEQRENKDIKLSITNEEFDDNYLYFNDKYSITDLRFNLGKNYYVYDKRINDTVNNGYASLLKLRYNLKSTLSNLSKSWEIEFLRFIKNIQLVNLTMTYATSQSLDMEINDNVQFDIFLVNLTFMLMTIFSTLLMSLFTNIITSPGLTLPSAGLFSAVFGMTSAFGLLGYLGYEACALVFVVPFLVIGVGIDDMFIIYASFRQTDSSLKTSDRIAQSLRYSGVSITITSLTDFTAFLVGLTAGFRSISIFCVYAACAIAFCYIYQLTFFSSFLVLHSKRIEQKRNTFLWCIKYENKEKSDEKNSREFVEMENFLKSTGQKEIRLENRSSRIIKFTSIIVNLIKKLFEFLIVTKKGKVIVGILFTFYISFVSWQASLISDSMDLGNLVSEKSYFHDYFDDISQNIDLRPYTMIVIDQPLNYSDPNVFQRVNTLLEDIKKIDGIGSENELFLFNEIELDEYDTYEEFIQAILKSKYPYSNDIVVNEPQNEIKTLRFYVQYERYELNSSSGVVMERLREFCLKQTDLKVFAFSSAFKYYEQFNQTLPSTLQAFLISVIAMFIISFIFIPDIISTICISITMISILIGLVGFMHLWGLHLSSITMIELVMSVGFCVDFSVHITHSFIACVDKGSRSIRAYRACIKTGLPIFNSALSTIIGVSLLGFAESYIFFTFFKTIIIVMSLGLLHSLLFLPVLLSLIGPHWKQHK